MIKDLMRLAILGEMPYDSVLEMSRNERKILSEVIKEKLEAQNPNKKSQAMVPGKVNAPSGPSAPRRESR